MEIVIGKEMLCLKISCWICYIEHEATVCVADGEVIAEVFVVETTTTVACARCRLTTRSYE